MITDEIFTFRSFTINYMKKFFFASAFIFLLSILTFSQTPSPTPPPADDDDVVKISTTLIQLDVTITDRKGNPIRDIKPEEVEIYENGKKQQVSNFSFVSSVRGKTISAPDDNKAQTIPVAPPTVVRSEQVRRTIALVVDDLAMSFIGINDVRRTLKKFVDEQMQEGDLVAIVRTGAGVGALQQFTTDKRQLYAAIEKVRFNPTGNGSIGTFAPVEPSPYDQSNQIAGNGLKPPVTDPRKNRESLIAAGTLGAINFVVRGMQALPGRKSIMLFSNGFPLMLRDKEGNPESQRVFDAVKTLVNTANRASVVIYTMDSRGLVTTAPQGQDNLKGKTEAEILKTDFDRTTEVFEGQEGLKYLAKETGGIAYINNNDFSGGVKKMLEDQSYYLIAYEPDETTFDPQKQRFNKIEIKVNRDGAQVRYRNGFYGVTDEQIAEEKPKTKLTPQQKVADALTSPLAANDISLRLNAIFGNESDKGTYIRSFLHISSENIKFTDEPNGKKKAVFNIMAVGYGDNGVAVDTVSKAFTTTVNEEEYKIVKTNGFIYDFIFPIKKPGAYQLRVAVYDRASEKVGSANQFVEVPDVAEKDFTLSGIIVQNLSYKEWEKISRGQKPDMETNPIGDTALRQFKAGTVLNYGMTVYNPKLSAGGRPDLTTQTRLFKDGNVIYEGKSQPVLIDVLKDSKRITASGSLNLGQSMEVGDYILQIIVTDKLADKKRQTVTQFVPFEIVQ